MAASGGTLPVVKRTPSMDDPRHTQVSALTRNRLKLPHATRGSYTFKSHSSIRAAGDSCAVIDHIEHEKGPFLESASGHHTSRAAVPTGVRDGLPEAPRQAIDSVRMTVKHVDHMRIHVNSQVEESLPLPCDGIESLLHAGRYIDGFSAQPLEVTRRLVEEAIDAALELGERGILTSLERIQMESDRQ